MGNVVVDAVGQMMSKLGAAGVAEVKKTCDNMVTAATKIKDRAEIIGEKCLTGMVKAYTIYTDLLAIVTPISPAQLTEMIDKAGAIIEVAQETVSKFQDTDPNIKNVVMLTIAQASADRQEAIAYSQAQAAAQSSGDAQALAHAQELADALTAKITASQEQLAMITTQVQQSIVTEAATIKSQVSKVKDAVYDAWTKTHPHSSGGYAYDNASLQGAKDAMNDKYGEGSVSW